MKKIVEASLLPPPDSPLEQSGFELPVPCAVEERRRIDKLRSRAMVLWLAWGALSCPLRSRWDREFESPLLQRRVCKPSVPREIRLIPEHIAGSGLESNCISISLRGVLRGPMVGSPFRAPQLRQELKQDLGRQRQCIPLSRIALRQGASQGEIDPEGAVAAEISSSLGGMLSRMPAISPRRPGRLAAFSF